MVDNISILGTSEHRQLTAVSCDLVDSTRTSMKCDPEDWNSYLEKFHKICGSEIVRFGGFISYIAGDGVSAYFGFPRAYEDTGQRAVEAARAIIDRVEQLYLPNGLRVGLRIGIATEEAIVGGEFRQGTFQQTKVSGIVGHLAQRIEASSDAGSIYISRATRELIRNQIKTIGPKFIQAKGFDDELEIWEIDRSSLGRNAIFAENDYSITTSPPKTFGRDIELAQLTQKWDSLSSDHGEQVGVLGTPGIGKTQILRAFHAQVRPSAVATVVLQGSQLHKNTPLYPITSYIRNATRLQGKASRIEKLEKLRKFLPGSVSEAALHVILAFVDNVESPPEEISGQKRLMILFEALRDLLVEASSYGNVLIFVEDVHWFDDSSRKLLEIVSEMISERSILLVTTTREKASNFGTAYNDVLQIELEPISIEAADQFVSEMDELERIDEELRKTLIEKSDCVPFFLRELTRSFTQDPSAMKSTNFSAPIRDLLQSRIEFVDKDVRRMLYAASVFGTWFAPEMICRITGFDQLTTRKQILLAKSADILEQRSDGTSWFVHALMHEQFYSNLLRKDKQTLHEKIAELVEREADHHGSITPEFLAHHWTFSSKPECSIKYWLEAGSNALAKSAPREAKHHFVGGQVQIAAMKSLSTEDLISRFQLNLGLGRANYIVDGPSAVSTVDAFNAAMDDIQAIDDPFHRCSLIYGVFAGYHFASRFPETRRTIAEMKKLAVSEDSNELLCQVHRMAGYVDFFSGEFCSMDRNFSAIRENYQSVSQKDLTVLFGADCLVAAQGFQAVADAMRSRIRPCLRLAEKNIDLSIGMKHNPSIGWAYTAYMYVGYVLNEPRLVKEMGAIAVPFCETNQIAAWLAHTRFLDLWAREMLSDTPSRSLDALEDAYVSASEALQLGLPLFRAALAKIHLQHGRLELGIEESTKAVQLARSSGQLVFLPEALLLQGTCFMRQGARSSARSSLNECVAHSENLGISTYRDAAASFLERL